MGSNEKDQTAVTAPEKSQRRIQSVGVGFGLVRILEAARKGLTLSQIAEAADMPPSQAHTYLKSFVEIGLLQFDADAHLYGLGPYAIRLGLSSIRQNDVAAAARAPMLDVQKVLKVPIFLSVWANNGPAIVSKIDFDVRLPMMIRVGYSLPLTQSSTGRLFLAYMSRPAIAPVLRKEMALAGISEQAIDRMRAEVRQKGYTASDSQLNTGFAAIAAPIFDYDEHMVGALTALGLRDHPTFIDTNSSVKQMRAAARQISRALGHEAMAPDGQPMNRPPKRAVPA